MARCPQLHPSMGTRWPAPRDRRRQSMCGRRASCAASNGSSGRTARAIADGEQGACADIADDGRWREAESAASARAVLSTRTPRVPPANDRSSDPRGEQRPTAHRSSPEPASAASRESLRAMTIARRARPRLLLAAARAPARPPISATSRRARGALSDVAADRNPVAVDMAERVMLAASACQHQLWGGGPSFRRGEPATTSARAACDHDSGGRRGSASRCSH